MKKTTGVILVIAILLLQVGCQTVTTIETTVPETTIVETQPLTSEETTTTTTAAKPTPTKTPTPTPTVPPETTVETTPTATTAATTAAPTPKPTKAPVETTPATTTTATTAAPTEPPPTTTATPTYAEDPEAIRDLIIQYCKDAGKWNPDLEKSGDSSVQWNVGDFYSDADYASLYYERKIQKGSFSVVSVSCWIDGTKIYIAHDTCMNP